MHIGGLCLTLALSCLFIASTLAADTTESGEGKPLQPKQPAQDSSLQAPVMPEDPQPPLETRTGTPEQNVNDGWINLTRIALEKAGLIPTAAGKDEPAADGPIPGEAEWVANARRFSREREGAKTRSSLLLKVNGTW